MAIRFYVHFSVIQLNQTPVYDMGFEAAHYGERATAIMHMYGSCRNGAYAKHIKCLKRNAYCIWIRNVLHTSTVIFSKYMYTLLNDANQTGNGRFLFYL